jgi:hypothetical protein
MDFAANLLSFSTPTHTHDLDNQRDAYNDPKTSLVQSLADSRKSVLSMGLNIETVPEFGKDCRNYGHELELTDCHTRSRTLLNVCQ